MTRFVCYLSRKKELFSIDLIYMILNKNVEYLLILFTVILFQYNVIVIINKIEIKSINVSWIEPNEN